MEYGGVMIGLGVIGRKWMSGELVEGGDERGK